jgi:spore germination cell wall hydrolase CwlJ-like protein
MKFPDQTKPIEEQDEDVLLAMLVWGESRGEPELGQLAVAHVPLTRQQNRLKNKKKYGNSLREIILTPFQFSCFLRSDPNRDKLLRPVESEGLARWAACWSTAVSALTGQSENPAPGATHYVVRRLWSRPTAVGRRSKWYEEPCIKSGATSFIASIGNHVFARTK